jgi:hypothetical protein
VTLHVHRRCIRPSRECECCSVVLGLDLDPSSGIDTPFDRAKLSNELVVVGIDVDLALFEPFPQCPIRIRPPSRRMITVSSSPKRAISAAMIGRRVRSTVRFCAASIHLGKIRESSEMSGNSPRTLD